MRIRRVPTPAQRICCLLLLAAVAAAQNIDIKIDGSAPRTAVSPNLYGIFFEEINHAGEGGLYAEMVLNRDFEIVNLPEGAQWAGNLLRTKEGWQERKWFGNSLHGWKLVAGRNSRASIRLDTASPLNSRNAHSMRLTVRHAGERIGVVNTGFWGMNFVAGKRYRLQFYARTEQDQSFDVGAALVSASGRETHAKVEISAVGGAWRRYQAVLTASDSDSEGRLLLTVNRAGTLWLDVVSLFPEDTFRGRPNGLRPDLARMLADLKPAFVRFPGGAIAGGLNLDNRIQWKNSIGDIAQRKGTMNLWGYYTTNGLGFHEYLQMCEDLNADAMWVANPGFSDNYRRAEYARPEDIPRFVDDALDALEYALGPADSRWGSLRAANGHAAPFRLKYVEIGNEAHGQQYLDNYKLFFDAIRARYPDVVIISNVRSVPGSRVEMVDDHRYGTPEAFLAAHKHYDAVDRNGPKVYVGEYGCNRNVGEGNLRAALAEAVFLLGLERNSDLVQMSSYAPLFFHVNDIAWPVNLIGFDSSRVFGRSSYYVQKLFAEHRPDEVLQTAVTGSGVFALAGFHKSRREVVLKVVNTSPAERTVNVELRGLSPIKPAAESMTLSHPDAESENSIDEPDLMVPQASEIQVRMPVFPMRLPANSLSVMRLALN